MLRAPLPDKGRSIAKGTHSFGNPRNDVTGDNSLVISSIPPEALNMPIVTIRSSIDGKISIAIFRFCIAPLTKESTIFIFFASPYVSINVIINGSIKSENLKLYRNSFILFSLFVFPNYFQ